MKKLIILSLLAILFFISFAQHPNKKFRLLEFNDGRRVWMTEEQVVEFVAKNDAKVTTFMDITDDLLLPYGHVPAADPLPQKPKHQELVKRLISGLTSTGLRNNILKLSEFHTRYYQSDTGVQAVEWAASQFNAIINALPADRKRLFNVEIFKHTWKQPSLIVTFKGTNSNPEIANQIVVIGSHIDSIAGGGSARSPGADDNASGSSTTIETFRTLAQSDFVPDRTLEFMLYAAEEVGLRGSQAIVSKYKSENKRVHAVMNLDMTGYNPNKQNTLGVVSDSSYTHSQLNDFIVELASTYCKYPAKKMNCGYACSDHASWSRAGYRATAPFEVPSMSMMNRYIHTSNDVIDHLDLERGVEFIKLGVAFAVELSKL